MSENGKVDIKSHSTINFKEASPHTLFAVSMYHRWILWALKSIQIITKPNKILHIPMYIFTCCFLLCKKIPLLSYYRPGGQGPTYVPPHVTESLLNTLKVQTTESVLILENILKNLNGHHMSMPTMNTFVRYC